MEHLTAHEAQKTGARQWLTSLVHAHKVARDNVVWRGDDGSFSVAPSNISEFDTEVEYVAAGTVEEYLDD